MGGLLGDDAGIIPARAGFTEILGMRMSRPTDHPRSRGVYMLMSMPDIRIMGSSPLARGLPSARPNETASRVDHPRSRGVYLSAPHMSGEDLDHPRSRGVYKPEKRTETHVFGSSPLARGLLMGLPEGWVTGGIIPARAGFTNDP